jgi:hypothetical protein
MKETKRGGYRPGSGRKPKAGEGQPVRKMVSVRLPVWLVAWLDKQPDKTATIEEALIAHHDLRPPGQE